MKNRAPKDGKIRCAWARAGGDLMREYHDREWGAPCHDERRLFEFILLEGAQAGLNWATVLNKRENYRRAFAGFDPRKIARFSPAKTAALLNDSGIIRNRLKIESAVINAKCFLQTAEEFGGFDSYLWRFTGGAPLQGKPPAPATSPQGDAFAKDMKRRGFKFFGGTIAYAYMQAVGMVNDHDRQCFRRAECAALR